jgi:ketosteroid isomerase-like protein
MKKISYSVFLTIVIFLSCLAGFASAAARESPQSYDAAEREIHDTEKRRVKAFLENDAEALAEIFSDDLTYAHSDGRIETKEQFLAALKGGALRYRSITRDDERIRLYGSTAVVNGTTTVRLTFKGVRRTLRMRYTGVYVMQSDRWQMVAWQTTPLLRPLFDAQKNKSVGGTDEGRAILQIIHDVAPGAQLLFATAFNSLTDFASNIRALRNAGCDIIVDDVFYRVETGLHDGQPNSTPFNMAVVTQAVNDVTAAGALYFSSAGNSGNLSDGQASAWEGDFVSGGNIAGLGDSLSFSSGNASNGVAAGALITMQWADPLGGSANDYDLYILNSSLTQVLASSTDVQNGDDDPFEAVQVPNDASGARIVVVRRSGAARFISLSAGRTRLQFGTSGQIRGHAGALNAFAVAATPAANFAPAPNPTGPFPNPFNATNTVELFSSDGPRRVFFRANGSAFTPNNFLAGNGGGVVRQKPEITAADGVSTTLPANSGLNPFFGTSAAAPHAAAIAGLIKSARPALTNGQIRAALIGATIDIEAPNVDRDSGAGIVDAFRSVARAFGVAGRAGDFNGDGRSDLVFRNASNGDVIVWFFNAGGTTFTSTRITTVPANSGWEIQGVGDFNGDGRSDLIWRNLATGEIAVWLFNLGGTTFFSSIIFNLAIDSGWEIQTVGDFNGDGRSDLMWRNYISGEVGPWLFNAGGTTFVGSTIFNLAVGTGWQIQSAGDFNGDGRTDLMWRNTITGEVGPWLFNAGGTTFTGVSLTTVDPNAGWEIQGVGDFNGDGRADLMWRNAVTGEVAPWIFNAGGTSFVSSIIANVATNTGWQIQRVGDFNGDGRADLMWRNLTTGEVGPWIFNAGGTSFVGSIIANLPQSGGQNIASPR